MNEIIKAMINQFGGGKAFFMIGGKVVYDNSKNQICVKYKMCKKANYMRMTYTSMDLYNMEFFKMKKYELVPVEKFNGLYCDMIKSTFQDFTGLSLSL